jgi:hypothetical protein
MEEEKTKPDWADTTREESKEHCKKAREENEEENEEEKHYINEFKCEFSEVYPSYCYNGVYYTKIDWLKAYKRRCVSQKNKYDFAKETYDDGCISDDRAKELKKSVVMEKGQKKEEIKVEDNQNVDIPTTTTITSTDDVNTNEKTKKSVVMEKGQKEEEIKVEDNQDVDIPTTTTTTSSDDVNTNEQSNNVDEEKLDDLLAYFDRQHSINEDEEEREKRHCSVLDLYCKIEDGKCVTRPENELICGKIIGDKEDKVDENDLTKEQVDYMYHLYELGAMENLKICLNQKKVEANNSFIATKLQEYFPFGSKLDEEYKIVNSSDFMQIFLFIDAISTNNSELVLKSALEKDVNIIEMATKANKDGEHKGITPQKEEELKNTKALLEKDEFKDLQKESLFKTMQNLLNDEEFEDLRDPFISMLDKCNILGKQRLNMCKKENPKPNENSTTNYCEEVSNKEFIKESTNKDGDKITECYCEDAVNVGSIEYYKNYTPTKFEISYLILRLFYKYTILDSSINIKEKILFVWLFKSFTKDRSWDEVLRLNQFTQDEATRKANKLKSGIQTYIEKLNIQKYIEKININDESEDSEDPNVTTMREMLKILNFAGNLDIDIEIYNIKSVNKTWYLNHSELPNLCLEFKLINDQSLSKLTVHDGFTSKVIAIVEAWPSQLFNVYIFVMSMWLNSKSYHHLLTFLIGMLKSAFVTTAIAPMLGPLAPFYPIIVNGLHDIVCLYGSFLDMSASVLTAGASIWGDQYIAFLSAVAVADWFDFGFTNVVHYGSEAYKMFTKKEKTNNKENDNVLKGLQTKKTTNILKNQNKKKSPVKSQGKDWSNQGKDWLTLILELVIKFLNVFIQALQRVNGNSVTGVLTNTISLLQHSAKSIVTWAAGGESDGKSEMLFARNVIYLLVVVVGTDWFTRLSECTDGVFSLNFMKSYGLGISKRTIQFPIKIAKYILICQEKGMDQCASFQSVQRANQIMQDLGITNESFLKLTNAISQMTHNIFSTFYNIIPNFIKGKTILSFSEMTHSISEVFCKFLTFVCQIGHFMYKCIVNPKIDVLDALVDSFTKFTYDYGGLFYYAWGGDNFVFYKGYLVEWLDGEGLQQNIYGYFQFYAQNIVMRQVYIQWNFVNDIMWNVGNEALVIYGEIFQGGRNRKYTKKNRKYWKQRTFKRKKQKTKSIKQKKLLHTKSRKYIKRKLLK